MDKFKITQIIDNPKTLKVTIMFLLTVYSV